VHALEKSLGSLLAHRLDLERVLQGRRACSRARVGRQLLEPGGTALLGEGVDAVVGVIVQQRAGRAQRKRLPRERCARQPEVRLDLLRQLVAEEERPAAGETRAAGVAFGRCAAPLSAALLAPPALECGQEPGAARPQSLGFEPAFGREPERRARQGEQQARPAQGAGGGAVEQQRVTLGVARREAPERRRRDVEFAKQRCARSGSPLRS
jgi:hypothetical protein